MMHCSERGAIRGGGGGNQEVTMPPLESQLMAIGEHDRLMAMRKILPSWDH